MSATAPSPAVLVTQHPLERYVEPSALLDFDHPNLRRQIAAFDAAGKDDVTLIREVYEFVRDGVDHSWDIQGRRVTATASEVLEHRQGICWAKSHLLAALLRGLGFPAGLVYQRLILSDDGGEPTYCVHGLTTVYVPSAAKWIRLDARGNKPGVDAQFSLDTEQLAFPVRPELGEVDYPTNYPEPPTVIVETLARHDDAVEMCRFHLPASL